MRYLRSRLAFLRIALVGLLSALALSTSAHASRLPMLRPVPAIPLTPRVSLAIDPAHLGLSYTPGLCHGCDVDRTPVDWDRIHALLGAPSIFGLESSAEAAEEVDMGVGAGVDPARAAEHVAAQPTIAPVAPPLLPPAMVAMLITGALAWLLRFLTQRPEHFFHGALWGFLAPLLSGCATAATDAYQQGATPSMILWAGAAFVLTAIAHSSPGALNMQPARSLS